MPDINSFGPIDKSDDIGDVWQLNNNATSWIRRGDMELETPTCAGVAITYNRDIDVCEWNSEL